MNVDEVRTQVPGLWSTKWKRTDPSDQYISFLDALTAKLGVVHQSGRWFISVPFPSFVRALPREAQALVSHLLPDGQVLTSNSRVVSLLRNMKVHPEISANAVMKGLRAASIEQKFCYTGPDSALRWYKFINHPAYRQSRECRRALEQFLKEKESDGSSVTWETYFRAERVKGIVILGGGSPSKDQIIFESMLAIKGNLPDVHLNFSIVDFSHFMALETLLALEESVGYDKRRIRVQPVLADFESLGGARHDVRHDDGRLAWFMLGGTLGNLNEDKFFRSIQEESLKGDWLIIGVETIDENISPQAKEDIEKKYRENEELRQFFYAPLMAGWNSQHTPHRRHADDIDEALKEPDVKLLSRDDDEAGKYVKVPNSRSLVVKVTLNDEEKTILKSTRYHEMSLVDYARHYRFRFVKSLASPDNAAYKILIFERAE